MFGVSGVHCCGKIMDNICTVNLSEEKPETFEIYVVQKKIPSGDMGCRYHVAEAELDLIEFREASAYFQRWSKLWDRVSRPRDRPRRNACRSNLIQICRASLLSTIYMALLWRVDPFPQDLVERSRF